MPTSNFPPGLNLENVLVYTPFQYDLIAHLLTFGVGAMAVGFVYFMITRKRSASVYEPSSVLSAVVMVSAFLILFRQLQGWQAAFAFDGEVWRFADSTFSNGYRYLNWSIDVPCLLTQMLYVLPVASSQFRSIRIRFVVAGLLMIYTGYLGQFYELTNVPAFMIWGAISTIFFVYVLYLVGNVIFRNRVGLPKQAYKTFGSIWWLLLISWTLYPLAYLVPLGWHIFPAWGAWAGVTRQFLYTAADVSSKVIYGVLLSSAAQSISAHRGHRLAYESQAFGDDDLVDQRLVKSADDPAKASVQEPVHRR